MDILLVRHGESEGNADGRLQGHLDLSLSERGRAQAGTLAAWMKRAGVHWDVAYSSPLKRARETAAVLHEALGGPAPEVDEELREIHAGALEGKRRDDIEREHPQFLGRGIMELADFSEFGGETYDSVQARVSSLIGRWTSTHRASGARVLVVGHGGVNFQLLKAMVCMPVPRVCIVRMGNCSATRVTLRERRGTFMGELVWHLPIELMGDVGSADTGALFR